MKGDEGRFLDIELVFVCKSGAYIGAMKGEGLFSCRFSNFQLFYEGVSSSVQSFYRINYQSIKNEGVS